MAKLNLSLRLIILWKLLITNFRGRGEEGYPLRRRGRTGIRGLPLQVRTMKLVRFIYLLVGWASVLRDNAVAVHGLGGLWGVMAVGLFGKFPSTAPGAKGGSGQWLAQLVGVATLVGVVLPMTYGLNWALDRFYPQRVPAEAERQGLDLYELGAGAYPEFMTHTDEFSQR